MKNVLSFALVVSSAAAHAQSYTCEFPYDEDAIIFIRTDEDALYNYRNKIDGKVTSVEMTCGDNVCAIRQAGNIQEYDLSHHVVFNPDLTEVVSTFVGLHVNNEKNIFDSRTFRIECTK